MPVLDCDSTLGGLSNYVARVTSTFDFYDTDYFPYHQADIGIADAAADCPAMVLHFPVSANGRVISADSTKSYFDDYYQRIHYTPTPIILGNILSDEVVLLYVWNSFIASKTLSEISVPSENGVVVNPPAGISIPHVMPPLEELVFSLEVSGTDGSPAFDNLLTFTLSGVDYEIPISGTRVLLFPFAPNWSSPFDETFEFNSWVLNAADGSEQTGSNWGNQPRTTFEYTISTRGVYTQRFENMLFGWQHRLFGVPHWAQMSKLTSGAAAGAGVISFDTTDRAFVVGGSAILYKDADTYEAFKINAMTDTEIQASSNLRFDWPAGSRVYPLYTGWLNETTSAPHQTDNTVTSAVRFDCEPSQSPVGTPTVANPATYQGEELYQGRLNWAGPITATSASDRRMVDYRSGRVKAFSTSGFSKITRRHNWQLRTRAESVAFRQWVGRREGIARPTYMPTGNTDLTLAGPYTVPTSPSLDVLDSQYAQFAAQASAKRDIIILFRDGTTLQRRIIGSVPLVDGKMRLTLDASLGRAVTPSQVKRISFLNLYRLDSNSITIRWMTDKIGTVEANLKMKTTG